MVWVQCGYHMCTCIQDTSFLQKLNAKLSFFQNFFAFWLLGKIQVFYQFKLTLTLLTKAECKEVLNFCLTVARLSLMKLDFACPSIASVPERVKVVGVASH